MNPELYREAPRSYWSLLYVVALFAVGFAVDAILGGAAAHVVGWLVFTALATACWALVLYAVRSQKSLVVTADELRVGDEALPRTDVVAFAAALDEEELPVLGWPRGKPRQLRGVTLRLADGRDVVVPTRHADRLRAALAVGDVPAREQDVRAAAKSDLRLLAEIADRAEVIFRVAGYVLPEIPLDAAELARAKAVFVAGRPPVGFVWLTEVAGLAHVEELAVIPKWMGQGIGTRLLDRAAEWARRQGYPAITLTTFADVPWNGPYYRGRGFVEVADLSPGLRAIRQHERAVGLDAAGRRVVMRRDL
ncbi:MAG TPA: GNAT family N-acetyltransferase [Jatrophihabitans sp.]|nr:GNAT family N-acetyltransferase [Jatrophihabitans sp.]